MRKLEALRRYIAIGEPHPERVATHFHLIGHIEGSVPKFNKKKTTATVWVFLTEFE